MRRSWGRRFFSTIFDDSVSTPDEVVINLGATTCTFALGFFISGRFEEQCCPEFKNHSGIRVLRRAEMGRSVLRPYIFVAISMWRGTCGRTQDRRAVKRGPDRVAPRWRP